MGKIAIFNQKGGVGKTTTIVNLAAALGQKNKKILILDLDPQANSSSAFGQRLGFDEKNIYDWLLNEAEYEDIVVEVEENLYLLPSNSDLAAFEQNMAQNKNRNIILKSRMEELPEFDFIFIDCPPSLGLLSINALVAADSLLIPIQTEYYALEGLSQLIRSVQLIQKDLNPVLTIDGILFTMYDSRNNLSLDIVAEVKKHFGDLVFETLIPRNVRLAEAPSFGQSAISYDIRSKGAKAYLDLADEWLERRKS